MVCLSHDPVWQTLNCLKFLGKSLNLLSTRNAQPNLAFCTQKGSEYQKTGKKALELEFQRFNPKAHIWSHKRNISLSFTFPHTEFTSQFRWRFCAAWKQSCRLRYSRLERFIRAEWIQGPNCLLEFSAQKRSHWTSFVAYCGDTLHNQRSGSRISLFSWMLTTCIYCYPNSFTCFISIPFSPLQLQSHTKALVIKTRDPSAPINCKCKNISRSNKCFRERGENSFLFSLHSCSLSWKSRAA